MKNLLFKITALIIVVSCNKNITENAKLISIDNNKFEFELPKYSRDITEEFKSTAYETNDIIIFTALCDTINERNLFLVSKYIEDYKWTIDEAFTVSVETSTNNNLGNLLDNFQLVDYKTYELQGKTFRYKISKHYNSVYSIMFYFMKNDYSNELYEIKMTADKKGLSRALYLTEKVALSVKIKQIGDNN